MGNRAVITKDRDINGIGVYLHWNGGRKFEHGEEYRYDLEEMIKEIDKRQPEAMRLTESEWKRFQEVKGKVLKARV